jgi:hypothetical protein
MGRRQNLVIDSKRHPAFPISIWAVVGAVVLACLLAAIMMAFMLLRKAHGPTVPSTAILKIIAAATLSATPELSAQTPENPSEPVPTLASGNIDLNSLVQVTGTGGDGLRLRDHPGINSTIRIVASEAEVFKVDDGPISADGYTWWHLVGPYDETRQGWAVANYLGVLQSP